MQLLSENSGDIPKPMATRNQLRPMEWRVPTGQKADPIFEIKGENIHLLSLSTGLLKIYS